MFKLKGPKFEKSITFTMTKITRDDLTNYLTKFTGKHLCQSLFFNKVAGSRHATLLKKGLWHRCFPVNFEKFSRIFFIEHLLWLLLNF